MGAALNSTTPKSVYVQTGVNMAPSDPLKQLASNKRDIAPNSLNDALLKKYLKYKDRDHEAFIENVNTGRMISNCVSGKLLMLRHALDGRYMFVKRDGRWSDNKTVGGQFQFYWTKLVSEWLSSNPELDPICPSDDDQVEEFISAVKIVQDHYSSKFYTTQYETNEFHSAGQFGTYITRYRFDPDKKDIVCELLEFPACRWDIRFIPEESSFFIYESKCATSVLEQLLDAQIQEDGDNYESNYGLQVIQQLATTGGNSAGNGKEQPYGTTQQVEGENTVIEMWLQPSEYCDINLEADTKTVGGKVIPKGQSLLEMFPDGMCVVGLNGMKIVWAIHAENVKDHIVSGRYHAQSFSGVGKGVSDAVDVYKELNDLHSQLLAHTKAHAMPGFGYNSAVVTEQMARDIGKPRKNIAFDFTQAPDGVHSINQVVEAILPGNPANSAFEYKRELAGDLQIAMQVTDQSRNPVLGVESNTATGDKIREANSSAVLVPQHLNKADHRKRSAVVYYNLFKRFVDAKKWFPLKDKNGITKGITFDYAQFDGVDIDFEIVSNSQIPKKPYAQEESMAKVLQFTGGIGGLIEAAQMNPELTGEVCQAFGAKLSIPRPVDIARVCRKRIEQAKKMLEAELQTQQIMSQATGIPMDNTNLAESIVSQLTPPISTKEPYYQQKVAWLAELLDSDEMQYAPQELRYVIDEMIDQHISAATLGQAQVQQDQSMAQIMSELPQLLGEQAMSRQNQQLEQQYQAEQQQAMQEQQMQQAQMQNQQQLAQEQQSAQIQERQSQADHQRAMALKDKEHAQNLQVQSLGHLATIEAAKAKPKAKSA